MPTFICLLLEFILLSHALVVGAAPVGNEEVPASKQVLILGGGVAGVIAARTLRQHGINDFVIIEARSELGGRMRSHSFAGHTVELGANWIQGTQTGSGPINPMLQLAQKHKLKTRETDFESISE